MKRVIYRFEKEEDHHYYEGIIYQEFSIPPKTFVRIGNGTFYGKWFDKDKLVIVEIPERSYE